ncbi:hypothetical protein K2Z83_27560 [Oscillochloris sp. ZM17-4]|uniref:hypothetical protein n=1 Tax=Oscillochloris sp. ZM17-4 TaxID=2866714 RepID=UPI001C72A129|nr:hypothetical protein [Oscillochloris sp. ZM17-4]MBX0331414.1 hypothetical protein [Oscillochloris sp. ZM17-4]
MTLSIDIAALRRFEATAPAAPPAAPPAPVAGDLLLIGAGNSGETLAQRICALALGDGLRLAACGLNNDGLAPRPLRVRTPDGGEELVELSERLLFGGDNPRDRLRDEPLLERRYALLLRGIPVFETFPRAGYGGHGHPVVSALDIDLNIGAVQTFRARRLRRVRGEDAVGGRSDWERLLAAHKRQSAVRSRRLRVVVLGGGSGSMGNAGHQLLPYLLRHLLREAGVTDYELWGVVLGPQAFSGLTPYTRHNYRALIQALDRLTRDGQRRAYLNDLEIAIQAPPYDRVFLLDDPTLGGGDGRVAEADLERFLDRAALSLSLILARGTVWPTIASHLANDDVSGSDGRMRYLHTVRAAMADVDRPQLTAALADRLEVAALDALAGRLAQ